MRHSFRIKRIYEKATADDGYRVLIDRIWPRGVSKEKANIDLWAKEVAPSSELRKWFCHKPERFLVFRETYLNELQLHPEKQEKIAYLKQQSEQSNVTLLYAAKDEIHNHAVVLYEYIIETQ
ncbi:DUF488 domain-containing protein [Bacillus sp. Marseille-P3661]|uniref:DUF488 domain-containing protein n=1 Tax=Bacillus sp. Marseille-P3661 TaxID=1936234 RepID=UPI000C832997|nr:DUF488 domain-containing protein [Bacillus sp. Marseille-P3661]